MKTLSKAIRLAAYLGLFAFVCIGVWIGKFSSPLVEGDSCYLESNRCGFVLNEGEFHVAFRTTPVVEEELLVDFTVPDDVIIDSVFIEGVNMFMGKTLVLFEEGLPENTAVTFLGSCHLTMMEWVMRINIVSDQRERQLSVFFTTTQA